MTLSAVDHYLAVRPVLRFVLWTRSRVSPRIPNSPPHCRSDSRLTRRRFPRPTSDHPGGGSRDFPRSDAPWTAPAGSWPGRWTWFHPDDQRQSALSSWQRWWLSNHRTPRWRAACWHHRNRSTGRWGLSPEARPKGSFLTRRTTRGTGLRLPGSVRARQYDGARIRQGKAMLLRFVPSRIGSFAQPASSLVTLRIQTARRPRHFGAVRTAQHAIGPRASGTAPPP